MMDVANMTANEIDRQIEELHKLHRSGEITASQAIDLEQLRFARKRIGLTDIERIRALAQTFLDEAQHQIDEAGEAGAHEAATCAKVCRQIIAEIALLPAVTSPDRIPPVVRKEIDDYASVGARPSRAIIAVLEGGLFDVFRYADLASGGDEIMLALPAIVAYIREAPHASIYGSPEAVSRWMARPRS